MAKRKPKNHYGEGSIFYSNVKQKWMAQINIGKDENGMPPKVLQHLMGHSDIKVTLDTYADVFDNFQSVSVEKADCYLNQVGLAVNM